MLELIHIGHSAKSRGINGKFKSRIENKFIPNLLVARALFINIDGSKVPFLIEAAEDQGHVILKLDEIDTPEEVSHLLSRELYLDSREIAAELLVDEVQQHELVGFIVYDQSKQEIGSIKEILEYPDQLLAKLDYQDKEVLLPIHEDLILDLDKEKKTIDLEIVEGLLDL